MTAESVIARDQAIKELMTPAGKRLKVVHVSGTSLYQVSFTDGGELPKELNQRFTDTERAIEKARQYLTRRWDEHEKPAAKGKESAA